MGSFWRALPRYATEHTHRAGAPELAHEVCWGRGEGKATSEWGHGRAGRQSKTGREQGRGARDQPERQEKQERSKRQEMGLCLVGTLKGRTCRIAGCRKAPGDK